RRKRTGQERRGREDVPVSRRIATYRSAICETSRPNVVTVLSTHRGAGRRMSFLSSVPLISSNFVCLGVRAASWSLLAGQVDVVINVLHVIAVVQHIDEFFEQGQFLRTDCLAGLREEGNLL